MKPVVKLAFLAVVLLILGGCQVGGPVTISPLTQTVTIYDDPGYATAEFTVAADGDVVVDFGDGTEEVYDVDASLDIEHDYYSVGTYSVLATQGSRSDRAEVKVNVAGPIVDVPFFLECYVDEDSKIEFNITRRYVGCDNGTEMYRTGISPGVGTTEFRMFAYTGDGEKVGLFDSRGQNVWGEWLPLALDLRDLQIITCWAGWTGDTPLIPMARSAALSFADGATAKGCVSDCVGCGTADPWIPPEIPGDAPRMVFTLEARNEYLTVEGEYPRADWRIAVRVASCE